MTQVLAIIQARLQSTRLPGKVLLDIAKRPMLEWVVERTHQSRLINQVVVATTTDPSDDELYNYCKVKGYFVKRGSVHDVLDRYYNLAQELHPEIIVRITADCPFIDSVLIDQAVGLLRGNQNITSDGKQSPVDGFDFVANRLPSPFERSYPIGLDIETFTFPILEDAWQNSVEKYQREHVAPYFYEDASIDDLKHQETNTPYASTRTPKGYRIALMHHSPNYGHLRWTVDTPEDLELARLVAANFNDMLFGWQEIIDIVQKSPELKQINAHIQHKTHLDVDQRSK